MVNSVALILAIVLSVAHYYGETVHIHKRKNKIISFGAGVMLAYLILDLFPQIFLGASLLNNTLFLFILIGFSLLHLVEKYIYQHVSKEKKIRELKESHSIAFFIYYFIIGIILLDFTNQSRISGFLLFFPLLFHTTIGTISIREIHHSIVEKKNFRIFLASSPIIGVLVASYLSIPVVVNQALLGFIGGVLLYIITREVIPKENKGDPIDFLLGMALYTILIVITWMF